MQERSDPSRETLDRVKQILRTDLRFENAPEITDDAPLLRGDLDLDSLDILLLVSSIEKAFGLKIPNEEIDASAFESVKALSLFVEDHQSRNEERGDGA